MSILLGWYLRKTAVLQKLPLQFSCSFCFVPLSDNSCEQLKIRSTFKMKFVNCFNIAHFISQHSKHINGSHVVKLYEYDLRSPLSRLLNFINSVTISNVFFAMFKTSSKPFITKKIFVYFENRCLRTLPDVSTNQVIDEGPSWSWLVKKQLIDDLACRST